MDENSKKSLEELVDVFEIIYSHLIKKIRNPYIAVPAADAILRIVMDIQEQRQGQGQDSVHAPSVSVDDVIAGLKKAMDDEHGQGGKK